jgi:Protein of unknown function (DUF3108)
MVRLVMAMLVLSACGSAAKGPRPIAHGRVDRGLPAGPPLVTPGEHIAYSLALGNVDLATFELAVGDATAIGDRTAIVVQSHAKALGLVQMIANVDDTFTSWIDVATGRPLRWVTDEYESKGSDKERTEADFAARSGASVPIQFHMNDDPPKPEPQSVSLPDIWDVNSFMVALRAWDPPAGTRVAAEVMRSRYLWHVEITAGKTAKLTTALGDLPARRLDGHTYKLDRSGAKAAGDDERDFTLWISDDDGRVPLRMTARTAYGDITMAITDYSPGTGKRLRD